jgi:hypothetical protein
VATDSQQLAGELAAMMDEQHEFLARTGTGPAESDSPQVRPWLIAQHADTQLDVQRLALRLLRAAVSDGEAGRKELAMLEDRVAVNEARKQTYGTQIADVIDENPVPWPRADPDRIDELRAQAGVEPFAVNATSYA